MKTMSNNHEEVEQRLTECPPDLFFKLAHHAKEQNLLQPWERNLMYNVGIYLKKEWKISEKMEAQAFRIIKATRICGLWSQVQEELHREEDYGERSKFDTQKKFEESIRSPFTDEWNPARKYLQRAFELEINGVDPKTIQEQIDKAREIDATYTDICLGRWSIMKKRHSSSKHD